MRAGFFYGALFLFVEIHRRRKYACAIG
jgi:hypothetical protein